MKIKFEKKKNIKLKIYYFQKNIFLAKIYVYAKIRYNYIYINICSFDINKFCEKFDFFFIIFYFLKIILYNNKDQ